MVAVAHASMVAAITPSQWKSLLSLPDLFGSIMPTSLSTVMSIPISDTIVHLHDNPGGSYTNPNGY